MREVKIIIKIDKLSDLEEVMKYIKEVCEKYNHIPLFGEITIGL